MNKKEYPYTEACIDLYNCIALLVLYYNCETFEYPHLAVTEVLFNARHEGHMFYLELFYKFIDSGYNPFRVGMTRCEKIQVKNIIAVVDKLERRCKI